MEDTAETSFSPSAIEAECRKLGHRKGWTFFTAPEDRLNDAKAIVVGLNPGGGGKADTYEYGGIWECPNNDYFFGDWGTGCGEAPLQRQVQEWHKVIGLEHYETCGAQWIPFRSPDWDRLTSKREALAFSVGLWRTLVDRTSARLFLAMGEVAATGLASLLKAKSTTTEYRTGWGQTVLKTYDTQDRRRIIQFPHPSRYRAFGRLAARSDLAKASLRETSEEYT